MYALSSSSSSLTSEVELNKPIEIYFTCMGMRTTHKNGTNLEQKSLKIWRAEGYEKSNE